MSIKLKDTIYDLVKSSENSDTLDGKHLSGLYYSQRGNISSTTLNTYTPRDSGTYGVIYSDYSGLLAVLSRIDSSGSTSIGSTSSLEFLADHYRLDNGLKVRTSIDGKSYSTWKTLAFTSDIPEIGSRNIPINGTKYTVYSSVATDTAAIYAPTVVGTSGYVLKSVGKGAPEWTSQSSLSVGSAVTAQKLTTQTATVWGKSYFLNGIPQNVSGNMTDVGNITFTRDTDGRGIKISTTGNISMYSSSAGGSAMGITAKTNSGESVLGTLAGVLMAKDVLTYTYYGGTSYDSPAMVITSGKYVGIGTTTPSHPLQVVGTISATSVTASTFVKSGSNNNYVLLGGGGTKAVSDLATSSHSHNYAGSQSNGGPADSVVCITGNTDVYRSIVVTAADNKVYYNTKVLANYGTGKLKAVGYVISSTESSPHIEFSRVGWNYLKVPSGGSLAVSINGNDGATSRLVVTNDSVYPGYTTGTVSLGTSSYPWGTVYGNTFSGNAASASKLATSRSINGTSFNGTSDITTNSWGKERTITIGNTGKKVDGSKDISWTLSEIGAAAPDHSHTNYVTLSGAQSVTGKKTFSGGIAITSASENTSMPYFLGIDAFADGGTVKYISSNYIRTLIGAAASSHTHSYLPLSGGTISSSSYGPLIIERSGSTNMAAVVFKNSSGTLGSIGMNTVNGNLIIYNAAATANRTILDSSNYTTWAATKDHLHDERYYNATISRAANTVLAAPNGSSGVASFRVLVAADIPTLAISKISGLQTVLDGKSNTGHTHNYAGSSSAGGAATSALTISASAPQLAAAGESNNINIVNNATSSITTNSPESLAAITKAIRFRWYNDYWEIGSIRGSSDKSIGFGFTINNNNLRFRITSDAAYVGSSTVLHTGNWSSYCAAKSHNHSASNITSGTLAVSRGGTGKTTLQDACNALINALSTGSSAPVDADYFVSQYAGGGTTYTTFHRRPVSALYSYMKGKMDSVYAAKSHTHSYAAATTRNICINANKWTVYSSTTTDTTPIYAPTSVGSSGQILVSSGATSGPTWGNIVTAVTSSAAYPLVGYHSSNKNMAYSTNNKVTVNPYLGEIRASCMTINCSSSITSYAFHVSHSNGSMYAGTTGNYTAAYFSNPSASGYSQATVYASCKNSSAYGLCTNGIVRCAKTESSSDKRLKENIQNLSDQNDLIKLMDNINFVSFNFKDDENKSKQYGFIAQDIQQYYPELVSGTGEGEYLSLDYNSCLILKIANLERKIKELENKLSKLEI